MVTKNTSLLTLFLLPSFVFAQDLEHLSKQLNCFNKGAYESFDFMISTRRAGEYIAMAEWSEQVSSEKIIRKWFPMEEGFQYVILLSTEENVDGTAIEIRDSEGKKLEYIFKINDLDNNQITFFYTPPRDDKYEVSFRTVNSHKPSTCMYMAILKGDPDPLEE